MKAEGSDSVSSNDDEFGIFDSPNLTGTPERRLILAVLERAMLDLAGNDKKEIAEAEAWLFDSPEAPYPQFSFPWICEHLDLDHDDILKKIKMMPRRGTSRLAPWYLMRNEIAEGELPNVA